MDYAINLCSVSPIAENSRTRWLRAPATQNINGLQVTACRPFLFVKWRVRLVQEYPLNTKQQKTRSRQVIYNLLSLVNKSQQSDLMQCVPGHYNAIRIYP